MGITPQQLDLVRQTLKPLNRKPVNPIPEILSPKPKKKSAQETIAADNADVQIVSVDPELLRLTEETPKVKRRSHSSRKYRSNDGAEAPKCT